MRYGLKEHKTTEKPQRLQGSEWQRKGGFRYGGEWCSRRLGMSPARAFQGACQGLYWGCPEGCAEGGIGGQTRSRTRSQGCYWGLLLAGLGESAREGVIEGSPAAVTITLPNRSALSLAPGST